VVHEARRIEQDVDPSNALGEGVDLGGAANVEPCRLGDAFLAQGGDAAFMMSVAITVAPSRANAIAQARRCRRWPVTTAACP